MSLRNVTPRQNAPRVRTCWQPGSYPVVRNGPCPQFQPVSTALCDEGQKFQNALPPLKMVILWQLATLKLKGQLIPIFRSETRAEKRIQVHSVC